MRMARIADRLASLGAEKWQVHFEGRRRAQAGEKVIFLSIGEPDAPPPAAILEVAEKAMRAGRYRYAPGQGEASVLEALARRYSRDAGRDFTPAQFLYLPGTQTALYTAAMTILDEGDEILLPDPYYATYEGVVAAPGAVAVPVRLDADRGFHPHVADFERAITPRTRAILINSPGNPTGAVYTAGEMAALGAMAKNHDLWIISDEVYATLTHGNRPFVSPFHDPSLEERTVVVSSLSKSHNMPGFRCGWIAASAPFIKRAVAITETMLFGSQPFLEDAAAFALDNYFPELEAVKETYHRRARVLVEGLQQAPAVAAHLPEGGMFVMVDVRKTGRSGHDFASGLLREEGVVTMPGESFGAGGAGHLRVALTVDEDQMGEATRKICRYANTLA